MAKPLQGGESPSLTRQVASTKRITQRKIASTDLRTGDRVKAALCKITFGMMRAVSDCQQSHAWQVSSHTEWIEAFSDKRIKVALAASGFGETLLLRERERTSSS